MEALDFYGNPIKIGDEVAFMQLGYRSLRKGVIARITPQKVFISHEYFNCGGTETKQDHNQVIVRK